MELDFESFRLTGALRDIPFIGEVWGNLSERYGFSDFFKDYNFDAFSLVKDLGEKVSTFWLLKVELF